jgi:HD-GYP domain-containing protein (c-di-GMP phosphodiesterase class II)
LGVANIIEAMSSSRSYRPAISVDDSLVEISKNKNILFDPEVVNTCLRLFKEKGFKF